MGDLHAFQSSFAEALLAEATPTAAWATQPGFAVYRNTVLAACIDALAANYPTVRSLLGEACFADSARVHARASPPASGVLADYGAGFARSLTHFAPAAELAYVPGVAALDRAWTESHLAADAPVLEPADLQSLGPLQLLESRLVVHPAARWHADAAMPVATIWRRHREQLPLADPLAWHGEALLLTRPRDAVEWRQVEPAAVAFVDACSRGCRVSEALERVEGETGADGFASWLPMLVRAGAFSKSDAP